MGLKLGFWGFDFGGLLCWFAAEVCLLRICLLIWCCCCVRLLDGVGLIFACSSV